MDKYLKKVKATSLIVPIITSILALILVLALTPKKPSDEIGTISSDDFAYTQVDDYIVIEDYLGKSDRVVIPKEINGIPVKIIGTDSFFNKTIVEVVIPEGVVSISNSAFSDCKQLVDISLPSTLTSIGSSAFSYCDSLAKVKLPDDIKTINVSTFEGCSSLVDINLSELVEIGESAFKGTGLTKVSLKNAERIRNYAFASCESLQEVTLYENLKYLTDTSFDYGCVEFKVKNNKEIQYFIDGLKLSGN